MAEWTKAAVLKTAVGFNAHRGFESLSLRLIAPGGDGLNNGIWGGARVADWGRLLSGCRGKNLDRGFESRPPRW